MSTFLIDSANFGNLEIIGKFKACCESLSARLNRHQLRVRPYDDSNMVHFSALPMDEKLTALDSLATYDEVCASVEASGGDLFNSVALSWKMLRRLNYVPTEDLFSHITDENVVEIYSKENVQRFRNFKFFQICSYTIEDLYALPWWKLYKRDDAVTRSLFALATTVLSGENRQTVFPSHGPHALQEIFSERQFSMNLAVECISPVFTNGAVAGFCVVERAQLLTH